MSLFMRMPMYTREKNICSCCANALALDDFIRHFCVHILSMFGLNDQAHKFLKTLNCIFPFAHLKYRERKTKYCCLFYVCLRWRSVKIELHSDSRTYETFLFSFFFWQLFPFENPIEKSLWEIDWRHREKKNVEMRKNHQSETVTHEWRKRC